MLIFCLYNKIRIHSIAFHFIRLGVINGRTYMYSVLILLSLFGKHFFRSVSKKVLRISDFAHIHINIHIFYSDVPNLYLFTFIRPFNQKSIKWLIYNSTNATIQPAKNAANMKNNSELDKKNSNINGFLIISSGEPY